MRKFFSLSIFCLLLSLQLLAGELPLPHSLSSCHDPAWQESFLVELRQSYTSSRLTPLALQMLSESLAEEAFPTDPHVAAQAYWDMARELDRGLKRGLPATQLKIAVRLDWKEVLEESGDTVLPGKVAKLIKEQAKDKPDKKIKADKEDKDKEDKDKKDKKDKEDKEKDKDKEEKE